MSLLNSQSAHAQYTHRPADERFPSIQALIDAAVHDKNLSGERTYNLRDLHAVATADDVQLASPRGAASLSHWSFGQLARTLGAPAGYLRDGLTPALAAECLNHGISQAPAGTTLNLLVRGANGQPPMIRAINSESYGRAWDADLYGSLQAQLFAHDSSWQLPPTWTGEPAGAYRGDRDSFLIAVNGGSIVTDPSLRGGTAGRGNGPNNGMYRGLLIRNSEVGAASITIESILFRYVCGNHMLWGAAVDRAFRRRHVGTSVLRDTLREIGTIAHRWIHRSAAADEVIIQGLIDRELAHTRDAVIDELRAMGFTAEQATSAYDRCERTEAVSPRSFWGIAQGATRLSQDAEYQDERYQLDKLAAVVLARGARLVAA